MSSLSSFAEGFLDQGCRRGRFLWNDTVLAEYVVPANDEVGSAQLFGLIRSISYHSVSALGSSTGTFIGTSIPSWRAATYEREDAIVAKMKFCF